MVIHDLNCMCPIYGNMKDAHEKQLLAKEYDDHVYEKLRMHYSCKLPALRFVEMIQHQAFRTCISKTNNIHETIQWQVCQ